jgi:hypothetical protein
MKKTLLFITIAFWATLWASQCAADRPSEEIQAVGPDPIVLEIRQLTHEHEQGRAAFDSLRREITQSKQTADSIKQAVSDFIERQEFERQLDLLSKQAIVRVDTPPCKPTPCYTSKGVDTTRLYVPKKKH